MDTTALGTTKLRDFTTYKCFSLIRQFVLKCVHMGIYCIIHVSNFPSNIVVAFEWRQHSREQAPRDELCGLERLGPNCRLNEISE